MAHITIDKKKYTIPDGSTAADTLDSLKAVMPELANAKLKKDGKNYKVEVSYGEKG